MNMNLKPYTVEGFNETGEVIEIYHAHDLLEAEHARELMKPDNFKVKIFKIVGKEKIAVD